jgi:hypothetical protein
VLKQLCKEKRKTVTPTKLYENRWSGAFATILKTVELNEISLGVAEFKPNVEMTRPSGAELIEINNLLTDLKYFESVNKGLQRQHVSMMEANAACQSLIDKFGVKYVGIDYHIGDRSRFNPWLDFENGVVKIQSSRENELTEAEAAAVQCFKLEQPQIPDTSTTTHAHDTHEVATNFFDTAVKKKQRMLSPSQYRSTLHVRPTSNDLERLFSQAKLVFNDHRRKLSSSYLENILFLKLNEALWSIEDIEDVLQNITSTDVHTTEPPTIID